MKKSIKILLIILSVIVVLGALMFLFKDHLFLGRDYEEDLYIDVPGTEYQILVKEWSFLMGVGQEVYFVEDSWWKRDTKLGQLNGGGDGYLPFANGDYKIEYEDGVVTLSCKKNSKDDKYSISESFELPID